MKTVFTTIIVILAATATLAADSPPPAVTERILVRGKKACGIYFCLHGPRSVKVTAIWETERNTILFYGSFGTRTAKTQLEAVVRFEPVA